jgi:hypothetical protein
MPYPIAMREKKPNRQLFRQPSAVWHSLLKLAKCPEGGFMSKMIFLGWLLVFCAGSVTARAQSDAIGFVKTVHGEATVSTSRQMQKAVPGTPFYLGSVLKTGKEGSMGVTFRDNTVMSLGADTEVTVDDYLYKPAKGDLKLVASMIRGTLHYLSGVIARLKPEAVALKTPTGIIGVRGTRFLVKVEE